VLVVDDDSGSLDFFAAALNLCGAAVMTASSAPEALRMMQKRRPHVVLSDIAMVGHDGYWLVREIRGPPIPRPALSLSWPRPRTAVSIPASGPSRGGFNDFLPNPVDPELLCRTIAKVAGR
jgi:CheY-like chemotaxis protein